MTLHEYFINGGRTRTSWQSTAYMGHYGCLHHCSLLKDIGVALYWSAKEGGGHPFVRLLQFYNIPQTEQREPKVTDCWMLPLATQCHTHYHLRPFYFMLFKVKDLVAKQHPTNTTTVQLFCGHTNWPRTLTSLTESKLCPGVCNLICLPGT